VLKESVDHVSIDDLKRQIGRKPIGCWLIGQALTDRKQQMIVLAQGIASAKIEAGRVLFAGRLGRLQKDFAAKLSR
jgi:hypothetical protein